jgi:hypothetical protein
VSREKLFLAELVQLYEFIILRERCADSLSHLEEEGRSLEAISSARQQLPTGGRQKMVELHLDNELG